MTWDPVTDRLGNAPKRLYGNEHTIRTIVAVTRGHVPEAGSEVAVAFPNERVHLFDAAGRRIERKSG